MSTTDPVIIIVDVETTGTFIERDEIIELAVQSGLGASASSEAWRFKPRTPIPAAATAVHGIRNEDVAGCPPFSSAVQTVRNIFDEADVIIGYNLRFDLEMIQAELRRANVPLLQLKGKRLIDPLALWRRCEPRSLSDAVKRFAGRDHVDAHSAGGDVRATEEVLLGMLESFKLTDLNWDQLAKFIDPRDRSEWIGESHHIVWQNEVPVFAFGKKHHGRPVFEAIKEDPGFAEWVQGKDFPDHVKKILSAAATMEKESFIVFIKAEFS